MTWRMAREALRKGFLREGTPKPSLKGDSLSVKEVKEDTAVCSVCKGTGDSVSGQE